MNKNYPIITAIVICMSPMLSFSQLPTIKAVCGEGRNIDWPKIKAQIEKEEAEQGGGPGFFYHDCDQGVIPIKASSTLANQGGINYNVKNINDDNPLTAWVEGKPDYGIGEFFEIKSSGVNTIYNGYQSSPKRWIENSRVKKFKVYKNNVALCFLELTDEMGRQSFELPDHNQYNPNKEAIYKFEIVDVYKGSKWSDVAISEINLGLCCVAGSSLIKTSVNDISISKLAVGSEIHSIDIETGELSSVEVLKLHSQRHLSLLKIQCRNKVIEITHNHPLYIKDFGFSSINKYMEVKAIKHYEDLIGVVEIATWDELKSQITFEKISSFEIITGDFETFALGKLSKGDTYITNGFVSRTY